MSACALYSRPPGRKLFYKTEQMSFPKPMRPERLASLLRAWAEAAPRDQPLLIVPSDLKPRSALSRLCRFCGNLNTFHWDMKEEVYPQDLLDLLNRLPKHGR
jgi:hypothetical protein